MFVEYWKCMCIDSNVALVCTKFQFNLLNVIVTDIK